MFVTETHLFETDARADSVQAAGIGGIDDVALRVEHFHDSLRRTQGLLNVGVGARQSLERVVEQEHGGEEGEKRSLRAPAVDDAVPPVPDDPGNPEGGENLQNRVGEGADAR